MLWFKGWMETRPRLVMAGLLLAFLVARTYVPGANSPVVSARTLSGIALLWMVFAAMLAGNGIRTQSGSMSVSSKGLGASTYFTLSLPVSRFRLLVIRTAVGLIQLFVVMMVACCVAWAIYPSIHAKATFTDALEYGGASFACTLVFYFLSALLSVFLDDYTWQLYGSMIAIGILWWLSGIIPLPQSVNLFRTLGEASPLITHTVPWAAMGVSAALGLALFLTTVKLVQLREF